MRIDIVSALNSSYITIDPKDKNHDVMRFYQNLPVVRQVQTINKHPFLEVLSLADIVKKFPNFFINNFLAFDENHQKKVCGNERLGNILKSDEIIELFQKDKIAYRHGERKTHPLQDKPSWLERIDKLFEGKSHLDEFSVSVQNQIIRQHSANNFLYTKENGLPCNVNLDGLTLKVAEEDGTNNHGHDRYLFEEFQIKDIELLMPNGQDKIFPVRVVELKLINSKQGYGDYKFFLNFLLTVAFLHLLILLLLLLMHGMQNELFFLQFLCRLFFRLNLQFH